MSTDRQRQYVIADLVSEAVMDGWLKVDCGERIIQTARDSYQNGYDEGRRVEQRLRAGDQP